MQPLSRKTMLALEAVIDVAVHARPEPVQAREITDRQQVPQRYLEQIMQALVRADILRGVRGPRGGYRLARERRRISIGEIIRVIDSLDNNEEQVTLRSTLGQSVIMPLCDKVAENMRLELDAITIEDLCRDAPNVATARQSEDFTI